MVLHGCKVDDVRNDSALLEQFIKKMEIVDVREEAINRCKPYIAKEAADGVHAATCLQTDAIPVTNDSDFDKIKDGVITVWSISDAIRRILISNK